MKQAASTLFAVAMVALALPAVAQMPQMGLLFLQGDGTGEGVDCTASNFQINVGPVGNKDGTYFPSPLTVNVVAITTAGPDRFADRHGGKFLRKADGSLIAPKNGSIKSSATIQFAQRQNYPTRLCWADDSLDTGDSQVMVFVANGPGYTAHPTSGRLEFTITDNDECANPVAATGGVVYRHNASGGAWGTCTCARESQHSSVRRLATAEPSPGQSEETWRQNLLNLSGFFHDPSHLYCDDSPYRGLP